MFVPHTPRGELARRIKEKEAQNNQGRKIRFKIVEKSGGSYDDRTHGLGKDVAAKTASHAELTRVVTVGAKESHTR